MEEFASPLNKAFWSMRLRRTALGLILNIGPKIADSRVMEKRDRMGDDHPDYTWNLRQEFLRKIKGK